MRSKVLALLGLFLIWVVGSWPSEDLKIVFCDVGQGDAELIIKGSVQVLIDGGPSGSGVLKCLGNNVPFWDRTIEMVVSTHADKDHIGGLDEVSTSYEIGLLIVSDPGTNQDSKRLVAEVMRQGIEVHAPGAGERLKIGGIEFEVLWPLAGGEEKELAWRGESGGVLGETANKNENSIVMRLSFGEFTALFTGDISEKEELSMVEAGVITPVTVLKVPHHGSKYSSSEIFLEKLKPKVAVIEVGRKNSYGHPSSIVTSRFDTLGTRLYRTDEDSEIVMMTDGKSWWVE